MFNNIAKIQVNKDLSIAEAMRILNTYASEILLVVDNKQLIGTITDGDIRRGILANLSLDRPIKEIMNHNPSYLYEGAIHDDYVELINSKAIEQIPILNANNEVIDLINIKDLFHQPAISSSAVLMAGGLGTRLMPLTENIPKPLLKINGKPILQIIIENLRDQGINSFWICVNYKSEMIKEYFKDGSNFNVSIHYIEEAKQLGTIGALSLLDTNTITGPLIVMNGDLLTKVNFPNLIKYHNNNKSDLTVAVKEFYLQVPYGVINAEEHIVKGIDEKPSFRFLVNAGIYCIEPYIIQYIPKNQYYDLNSLINNIISHKKIVSSYPVFEYWKDIGQMEDFIDAQSEYRKP